MATKIQIAPLDASEWQVAHLQRSAQPYVSRRWNYEDGLRLVLASGERTLEASIFRHYLDDQHVKTVVELPDLLRVFNRL